MFPKQLKDFNEPFAIVDWIRMCLLNDFAYLQILCLWKANLRLTYSKSDNTNGIKFKILEISNQNIIRSRFYSLGEKTLPCSTYIIHAQINWNEWERLHLTIDILYCFQAFIFMHTFSLLFLSILGLSQSASMILIYLFLAKKNHWFFKIDIFAKYYIL